MIHLKDVSKVFPAERGKGDVSFLALNDINLHVNEGELVSIIGPSGCGKSTLLNLVAGILPPTSGEILINGLDPQAARLQRYFGIVFQKAVLLPWRSVLDNVRLPLQIADMPSDEAEDRCNELLELVGLTGFENHWVHQLSGGMQQRVSVARALSFDPPVLLMDEPFGALDDITRQRMDAELLRIWRSTGKTILFVTHNIMEAAYLSEHVVVMSHDPGRILDVVPVPLPVTDRASQTSTLLSKHVDRLGKLLAGGNGARQGEDQAVGGDEGKGVQARSQSEDRDLPKSRTDESTLNGDGEPGGTRAVLPSDSWWKRIYWSFKDRLITNRIAIASGLSVILIWELVVRLRDIPGYLLPAPSAIAQAFVKYGDLILRNTAVTLTEILLGFMVATVFALLLAMLMILSQTFRKAVYPYLIASQTTPHIAWAPLLLIWLGFGLTSKIVVAALVAFFPVVVNALDGMESVDMEAYRLFHSLAASRREILLKLQIPYALTHIFSGMRVAMAFSVVGAIIAEWVGAERGLGVIIIRTMFDLRVDLMFAIIIVLSVLGTFLFMLVGWIEGIVMPWRESHNQVGSRMANVL